MKIYILESKNVKERKYGFFCPACNFAHWFRAEGDASSWKWNGDFNNPTINPSILAWWQDGKCHSFVENGKIKFLSDCTHDKKGQTMDLPDWDDL